MDTPTNPLFLTHQTSPASSIITAEFQTGTQGHVALNIPTPSLLAIRSYPPNVQNPMLDPENAQHMATDPAMSFPKRNTPSPQLWKGLHLHHERKPRAHNATHKGYPTKQKGTTTL